MNLEDAKSIALKRCIDIYNDYEADEVKRWAPKSVQLAWETGRDFMDAERKKDHERIKDFTL